MNLEIAQAKALGNPDGSYVEEMRLWHGSPYAEKICSDGFNLKPAKANGMFGKGIFPILAPIDLISAHQYVICIGLEQEKGPIFHSWSFPIPVKNYSLPSPVI